MDFMIDDTYSVQALADTLDNQPIRIRRYLLKKDYTFAEANSFALFAVHGPYLPNGKPTLTRDLGQRVTCARTHAPHYLRICPN